MVKSLSKHGNSLALVIEKPVLELLGADAGTAFEITTDGRALVLTPVLDPQRRKQFNAALKKVNEKYPRALKKLAE
jgi:antitoxin component of MazEF toxin-antitoxin module